MNTSLLEYFIEKYSEIKYHPQKIESIKYFFMSHSSRLEIPYPSKTDDWAPHRAHIIATILQSERQYVQHLYHFIFEIRVALAEANSLGKIKNLSDDVENLFRRVAPIYKLNTNFLALLESSITSDVAQSKIGDCFNSYVTLFKAYQEYSIDYLQGIDALEKQFKSDPALSPTIKDCEMNVGVTITELLRLPIERIPRYKLQLLRLLKVTPREHLDRAGLVAAFIQITPMANPFTSILYEQGTRKLRTIDEVYPNLDLNNSERYLMFYDELKCFTENGVTDIGIWMFNDSAMIALPYGKNPTPVLFAIKNIKAVPVDVPAPYEYGVDFLTSTDSYRICFKNQKRLEAFVEVCENLIIDLRIDEDAPPLAPVRTPFVGVKDCVLCGRAFGIATKPIMCAFCRRWCCKKCLSTVKIGDSIFQVCKRCSAEEHTHPRPHMLINYEKSQIFHEDTE